MSRFRFHILLLFLGALVSLTIATSPPLFCKCTCQKNSTLIALGPQSSCAQCTHAYCLSQSLLICQDSAGGPIPDTEVLSTCIQRDSRKDQIIVWAFLLGTAGLLVWAGARRVREMREGRRKNGLVAGGLDSRGPYIPVSGSRG
ncbi:putative MFS transporter [Xylaria arbuscula]|nr:putative MFS transporter [Xylaria arbuscula]